MYTLRQTERLGKLTQSLIRIGAVDRNDYCVILIGDNDVATVARVSHHIAGLVVSWDFLFSNQHRFENYWMLIHGFPAVQFCVIGELAGRLHSQAQLTLGNVSNANTGSGV